MLRPAMTLTMLLSALILAAGAAQAADVYKYTDEKGNTLYTDKPATLPAQRMSVNTKTSTPPATPAATPSAPTKTAPTAGAAAATPKPSDAPLTSKERADRCAKARDRFDIYATSHKLYEEKGGGERRYLTSEEIDAARASAKANMDVWCK